MTERKDPVERALEVLVYAPLGIGLYVKDTAPAFLDMVVARGRAELDRRHEQVHQRVTTARSLGQVAMAFGLPVLRRRVQQHVDSLRERAEEWTSPARERPPRAAGVAPPSPNGAPRPPTATSAPGSDHLPIPGYDALSASQVVERLTGLGGTELAAVRAYEAAHRNRRTILGKIEQLSH